MNKKIPLPSSQITKNNTHSSSNTEENDLFADTISADEFVKQIKNIQQSNDEQDVDLRDAARNFMKTLSCV